MDTRERILTKTIMEIVDKSKIIRNGLQSLEWPYVTVLPGKDQKNYYRYNLEDSYLLELIDVAEIYRTESEVGLAILERTRVYKRLWILVYK